MFPNSIVAKWQTRKVVGGTLFSSNSINTIMDGVEKKVCCTKTMHQGKKLQLTCLFDRLLFLLPRARGTVINHTCRSTNLNVTSIWFCACKHAITKVSRFFYYFESCASCLATNRKDTIMANTFYYLAKSRHFFCIHSNWNWWPRREKNLTTKTHPPPGVESSPFCIPRLHTCRRAAAPEIMPWEWAKGFSNSLLKMLPIIWHLITFRVEPSFFIS